MSKGPMRGPGPGGPKPKFNGNSKEIIKRLMHYLGKDKGKLVLVAILAVINSSAVVISMMILQPITNLLEEMLKTGVFQFASVAKLILAMAATFILAVLCGFTYNRIMMGISQRTIKAIRKDLFDKVQTLPISYFDTHPHGDMMSLFTNDIDMVSESLNSSITTIITASFMFIGVFIGMIVMSPILTVVTAVILGIIMLLSKTLASKSGFYFGQQQRKIGALNGYIEEMIEGQKVIKVFCHEDKAVEQFTVLNEELRKASTSAQSFAGAMMPMMGNLSHINYAVNCVVGSMLCIAGVMPIGSLVAFLQLNKNVSQPINQFSQQMNVIIGAMAGAERIFNLLDLAPEVDEGKVTLVEETVDGRHVGMWKKPDGTEVPLEGDVRFDNVVFGYNSKKTILKGISLFAKPGQKVAFVGSTGAGKTTITNLINRFYDINSGAITYDGINVNDIKKDDLRKSIGIILQDTHLFTGTIADNIRYGKLDATDEEVIAAAKLANAHAFIKHLPQGYDTVLTGDGEGLSQGQRQLLAIARAAIANPLVLIMDEATSSIDTRTEKLISAGMDKLMEGRTVFVIAHRLSTIKNADVIMVLEQGEIIERGNHEELLEQKGKYYQLYTGKAELD